MGCFGGITYALLSLGSNPNDVISNLPNLIAGLKFAFVGSTVGIASALYLRYVQYKRRLNETSLAASDVTNGELLNALNGLKNGIVGDEEGTLLTQIKLQRQESSEHLTKLTQSSGDLLSAINALSKGIIGDEDGTLLTQIKVQRQESADNLTKLRASFDAFAERMVENSQKAIIEALERVIRDFNEKLTEQFGENFKQLNSAVTGLVTWQQQYKEELNQLKIVQQQSAGDMKIAAEAFSQIVARSGEFATTAEKLKELMDGLDKQNNLLFTQEKALSELLIGMKDVTPEFAEKVDSMLTVIKDSVSQIQGETQESIRSYTNQVQGASSQLTALLESSIKDSHQAMLSNIKENSGLIKDSVSQIQNETQESIKNYTTQVREASGQLTDLLSSVIKDNQRVILDNLKENSDIIKDGVVALDKALQEELNKSLQALGQQLAALSEKFVSDYLPLTESLRDVVRLAESIRK